jgi:hypothetical protein
MKSSARALSPWIESKKLVVAALCGAGAIAFACCPGEFN